MKVCTWKVEASFRTDFLVKVIFKGTEYSKKQVYSRPKLQFNHQDTDEIEKMFLEGNDGSMFDDWCDC